ncbi:DUF2986 domain-containing protein [Psychromonas aquimarina]|uniref:DUF2986 domain-containing protein n=1 Tax=Psychromonas aquimarina TaxID=444919 RepID=UPI00041CD5F7|nr:DUF2986 domain-containing protein [Psychromonas aquimarina]
MNRKKKINSILKKRVKQMNAKKNPSQKPKYISKAERARLEALETAPEQHNESLTSE